MTTLYTSSDAIDTNRWTHIAVVVDKVNEVVRFYKDNVLIDIKSAQGLNLVNNDNFLLIGKNPQNTFFSGILDDVRVYDDVLTKRDLQNIYNEKLDRNLILHYDFEKYDHVKGEVYDESIYGSDGELINKETEAKDFTKEIGQYAVSGTAFNADVDQYIRIPTTAKHYVQGHNLDNCTMTAWVKTNKLNSFEPILHKDGVFSFGLDYGHAVLRLGDGTDLHPLPAITLMDTGMDNVLYKSNFDQPARSLHFMPNGFAYNKYFSVFRSDENVVDEEGLVTVPSGSAVPKTLAFWFKGVTMGPKYYAFSLRTRRDDGGTSDQYFNRIIANRFYFVNDRYISTSIDLEDVMYDNQWHHHVVVYDINKSAEESAKYYLDGVQVGSGLNNTISVTGSTNIGEYTDMGIQFNKILRGNGGNGLNQRGDESYDIQGTLMENEYFLCEFAYWNNVAMTTMDVKNIYKAKLGTLTSFDTVPNVYYSFASQDLGLNKGTYHTEKYSLKGYNIQLSYDIPENRRLTAMVQSTEEGVVLDPPAADNHLVSVNFNGGEYESLKNTELDFVDGYYDGAVGTKINETQHLEIAGAAFENTNMNIMSFSTWIKPESVAGTQPILSREGEENTILFSMVNNALAFEVKNGKGPGMADITVEKKLQSSGTFSLEVQGYVADRVSGSVYVVALKNQYANTEQVLINYIKANVSPIKSFAGGQLRTYFKSQPITTYLTTHTSAESNPILYDSDFYVMLVTIDVNNLFDVYYVNNRDIHTSDYDPKLSVDNAVGLFDGERLVMNFTVTSRNEVDVMVSVHNKLLQVPYNFDRLDTVSNVSNMSMSFETTEANYTTTNKVSVKPLSRVYVYIELVNVSSGQRISERVAVDNVSVRDATIPYVNITRRSFNQSKTSMELEFTMYSSTTRIVRYYVANFVSSTKQITNDSMYITIITNKESAAIVSNESVIVDPFVVRVQTTTLTHGLALDTNTAIPLTAAHTVDTRVLAVDEVGRFYLTNSFDSYLYYQDMVYNSIHALGLNNYSQLGDSSTTNQTESPIQVLDKYNIVKMSTGYRYTMFVTANNELYGMGYNNKGQIGNGSTSTVSSPVQVLPNQRVKDVVCGYNHTVILTVDGKVFVTGNNGEGQFGTNSTTSMNRPVQTMASHRVKFIAVSYQNSYFVTEENRAYACGRGSEGQIGDGANSQRNFPVEIVIPGERIVEVYATKANNSITTYYRTLRNELYSTGYNGHGQIGNKTSSNINTPFKIPMEMQVKRVACSDYHTVILDVNNRVFVLGYNANYQLGTGNTTNVVQPTEVAQHLNVRRIECGYRNTYFMTVANELYAVGRNTYGELGSGNTTQLNTITRVIPPEVTNLVAVESSPYPDGHHVFFFTGISPETSAAATEVTVENGAIALKGHLNSGVNKSIDYYVFGYTTDRSEMTDSDIETFVAQHSADGELLFAGTMPKAYDVVDLEDISLTKVVDATGKTASAASVNFVSIVVYMRLENGSIIKQTLNTAQPSAPKMSVSKITYDGTLDRYRVDGSIFAAVDAISSYYLVGLNFDTDGVTDADLETFAMNNKDDDPVVKVTENIAQGAVFDFQVDVPALFDDIDDNTAVFSESVGANVEMRVIVTMASDSSTAISTKPRGDYVEMRDVDWSQETANTPDYDLSKTHTTNGNYGMSSSLSYDGKTALVAGYFNNSTRGGGWIWTYDEANDEYKETGDLSINGTTYGEYGQSCALSADGKIALIAGYHNTSQGGAFVWTFDEDSNAWSMRQDLSKTSGSGGYYGMACACDASANTLLITGYNNQSSGCAYVFHRDKDSGLWSQTANLSKQLSGGPTGYYGHACALSADGKTALISGYYDTTKGSAFVFTYDESTGTWTETADLSKPNSTNGRYGFRCDLSADGKIALITGYNNTSGGGAFVWTTTDGKTWSETADLSKTSGAKGNYGFSCSLSADGTLALIAGHNDSNSGGAWLWTYDGSSWNDSPYDLSKNASTNGKYGQSSKISKDGTTVVVAGFASTSSGGAWIWRGIDNGLKSLVEYTPAPEIPLLITNTPESLLNPHVHDVFYDQTKNKFILYGSLHSALDNAINNVYAMGFVKDLSGNKKVFGTANASNLSKKVVTVQKDDVEFFTFELPMQVYNDLNDVSSTVAIGGFENAEFRLMATNGTVTTLSEPRLIGVGNNGVAMYGVHWDGVDTVLQTFTQTSWCDMSGDGMRMVITKNISTTSGSMHVYEYNEGTDQYDEVYTHTKTNANGRYGNKCHISTDGNSIIVSGHKDTSQGCGFVWQYDPKTNAWGRFNPDGSHTEDSPHDISLYTNRTTQYGMECAISGDGKTVCIGGYHNNYHGEIYVMHYDDVSARWGRFTNGSFNTSYDESTDRYNIGVLENKMVHYYRDTVGPISGHVQVGRTMDLSGDGSVMVFGMYRHDVEHISSLTDNRIYMFHYNKETGDWGNPHKYHRHSTSDTGRFGKHVAVSANGKVVVVSGENSTSGRSWIYHYSDDHKAWGKFLPDGSFLEGQGHIYAASSNGNYPQRGALSADGKIAYFYSKGSSQGGIYVWQYNDATHNWGHYEDGGVFVPDQYTRVAGEFDQMCVSANGRFVGGNASGTLKIYQANYTDVVSVVNFGQTYSNKAIYLSRIDASFEDGGKMKVELEVVRPEGATVSLKVYATTNKALSGTDAIGMNNSTVHKTIDTPETTFTMELGSLMDVNGTIMPFDSVGEVDVYVVMDSTSTNAVIPNNLYKMSASAPGASSSKPYAVVTALYERVDNTVAVQGSVGSVYGVTDALYMVAFANRDLFATVSAPEDLIVSKYDAGSSQVSHQSMSVPRYAMQKVEWTLTHVYTDAEMTTTVPISVDQLDSYDVRIMAVDSTNSTRHISAEFTDMKAVVYSELFATGRNDYYQLGNFYNNQNFRTAKRVLKGYDVMSMAIGTYHGVIVTTDGKAYSFGYNDQGQLGTGNTTNYYYHPYRMMTGIKKVACGDKFTMLLKNDGTVYGVGDNGYGQLGNGNTSDQKTPVLVMSDVKDVVCGDLHTLFIKTDGSLYVCGYNGNGGLGRGNTTNVSTPAQVTTSASVKAIFAGYRYSFYITVEDEAFGFGLNDKGQLGLDDTTQRTSPTPMTSSTVDYFPAGKTIKDISLGYAHTIFLFTDGSVYTTGRNSEGQLGDGTTTDKKVLTSVFGNRVVSEISAFRHGSFFVSDNKVYATGQNNYYQLGDNTTTNRNSISQMTIDTDNLVKIVTFCTSDSCIFLTRHTTKEINIRSASFVRTNAEATMEVKAMGTPMTWYVMGVTSNEVPTLASVKQTVLDTKATAVVRKGTIDSYQKKHVLVKMEEVMTPNGPAPAYAVNFVRVYAYAVDQAGNEFFRTHDIIVEETKDKPHGVLTKREKLSTGVLTEAVGFSSSSNIVEMMIAGFSSKLTSSKIAKARNMVLANKETSAVHLSVFGGTNSGNIVKTNSNLFTKVFNGDLRGGFVDITADTSMSSMDFRVITVDDVGNVVMSEMFYVPYVQDTERYYETSGIGYNGYEHLAVFNGRGDTTIPLKAVNMRQVAKGYLFTVYLDQDGFAYGLGYNNYGQLGTGNTTTQYTPVSIAVSNVKKVACGYDFSVFLTHSGELYTCGRNNNGQLGIGNTTDQKSVVKVISDHKFIDVVCGSYYMIAITENYDVFGCGNNGNYQLGTSASNSSRNMMTQSSFDEKVKQVYCGTYSTIFVATDNRIFGVGTNGSGEFGSGDTSQKNEVTEIFSGKDIIHLSIGSNHTGIVTKDLKVFMCGRNNEGQIGDGSTSNKSSPTQVLTTHDVVGVFCGNHNTYFRTSAGKMYATGYNNQGQLGLNDNTNRNVPEEMLHSENIRFVTASKHHNSTIVQRAYLGSTRVDIDRADQDRLGLSVDMDVLTDRPSDLHVFVSQVNDLTQNQIQSIVDSGAGVKTVDLNDNSFKSVDDLRFDTVLDTNNVPVSIGVTQMAGTVYAYVVEKEARPAAYAPSHTVNVTVSLNDNMKYVFDPVIAQIEAGNIYVFDNTSVASSHPLRFTASDSHPGMESDSILFHNDDTHIITVSLPTNTSITNLYAHCGLHQNMGSEVNPIGVVIPSTDAVAVTKTYTFKRSVALKRSVTLPPHPYTGVFKEVYVVGRNNYYHLGTGDNSGNGSNTDIQVPVPVHAEYSITQMRVNHYNTAFITDDGRVFTDGHNNYGQLGNGNTTSYKLTQAMAGHRVKQVELSHSHTAFVTEDNEVFVCGRNNEGYKRLGTGDSTNYSTPKRVMMNHTVKQVALGYQHTMFLTDEGEVFGVGRNDLGNVGNDTMGNTSGRILRTMIPDGMKVAQIECAKYSTYFLMTDGSLYATGYNDHGEIGVGSTSPVKVPEKMQGLGGQRVIKISAGFYTVLALTESGQMFACGRNNEGQTGTNPSDSNRFTTFTQINTNNRKVIDITASGYSSFFVTDEFEAYGLGYNNYGQLGDHSKFNRYEPYQVRCDGKKIGKVFGGMYDTQSAFFGIVDPDQKMSIDKLQIERNLVEEVLDVSAKVDAPFDSSATYRVVASARLDMPDSEARALIMANAESRAVLALSLLAGTSKTVKLPLTHVFDGSGKVVRSATVGGARVFAFLERDGTTNSVIKSEVFAIPSTPDLSDLSSGTLDITLDDGSTRSLAVTTDAVTDSDPNKTSWILVLNYMHKANTNPGKVVRNFDSGLPVLPEDGSLNFSEIDIAGIVENGKTYHADSWGHAGTDLFDKVCKALGSSSGNDNGLEVRFLGKTSNHTRMIHFKTHYRRLFEQFRTSAHVAVTGSLPESIPASDYTTYSDSSATSIPAGITRMFNRGGDNSMLFCMNEQNVGYWTVAIEDRYEVDDYPNGSGTANDYNTYHQIWVRANKI